MGDYRKLQVWQRAHRLACRLDAETRTLARGQAALRDQLRRAALSIPTNLAEGSSRGRDGDFGRYINIAIGSAAEAESLLLFARDTGALDPHVERELEEELTRVRQMLFRLRAAVTPDRRGAGAARSESVRESEDESREVDARRVEGR